MARQDLMAQLEPGDLFHARFPNGAVRICIVTSVEDVRLSARSITTQERYSFDRVTGATCPAGDGAICTMDSVHPLPADVCAHLREIDRRYAALRGLDEMRLCDAEQRALLDAGSLFESNPLPAG
ncbi:MULTISPECIES: hypothetical protein [unclassified Bradyrhizobium]|uniref:hypothetical protein n=1 Tax=unclassified Bradyrhizobium TaxID=2631580 RepID=UPI002479F107|nr:MULTISPECIES: hypothetical protein [unclassified Bradyrhizobium]WGR74568.1 hypothetical protein MTX24_17810 [Bradyrhizobium sp. ISRA426]WGR79403.1 hypothetical protein MTX21_02925 [Bradyrhizobium sp. ISRA430]WGR89740.1 hypothetical protein MTX25_17490 [Bradyrhizobium sp. ISRA432]